MENEVLSERSQRRRQSGSPFDNREIEPHGVEKYLATLERRNAEEYNAILSNRIAKLLKEEENSRKQMENTQKREIAMMNNRERHMNELREKELIRTLKKQQEDELRMKNFIERERRKKNISDMNEYIYNNRKNCFAEVKQNAKIGDYAIGQFHNYISKQRNEKVQVIKFKMNSKKHNRSRSQFNYKNKLRKEYEDKIQEEKQLYLQSLAKRKQLEAIESELVQNISVSQGLTHNFTSQTFSPQNNSTVN